MPESRVFNTSVFQSYTNLKNFFQQSDAINQVLSKKDIPYTKTIFAEDPFCLTNPHLAWHWKVCQVATFPVRILLVIPLFLVERFTALVGTLSSCGPIRQCAKTLKLGWRHLNAGFNVYSEAPTKRYLIKTAVNEPYAHGKLVDRSTDIKPSEITDPKVKKRTYSNGVKFGQGDKGICKGMCTWLGYLYLKTKDQFSDPRAHIAALGKQFKHGGGMDPVLLQAIDAQKGGLLGLKIGAQPRGAAVVDEWPLVSGAGKARVLTTYNTPLYSKEAYKWNSSSIENISAIQNLPVGFHFVRVPKHMTAYIKINDKLGYFFDPNDGFLELRGDNVAEELHACVSEVLDYCTKRETVSGGQKVHEMVAISPITLR